MQVVERTRHINVTLDGIGIPLIKDAILKSFPKAKIIATDDEYIDWDTSKIANEIRAKKTPGKILSAYREREGLSVTELAEKTGIKYTNISAMENDRRTIGLRTAKKLGDALNVNYVKFLK